MGANVRAINQNTGRRPGRGEGPEDQGPAALSTPVSEAVVYSFSVTEVRRQVSPANPRPGDPDDRVQEVSGPQLGGSTCARRAQRADSCPLGVCETVTVHARSCQIWPIMARENFRDSP